MIDANIVAQINATVIAIAVAVGSVYGTVSLGSYTSRVGDLLDAADQFRVNARAVGYGWHPSPELAAYLVQDRSPKDLLLKVAQIIAPFTLHVIGRRSWEALPGGPPSTQDEARMAEDTLHLLGRLVQHPPFNALQRLQSIEEARRWANDVRDLEPQLSALLDEALQYPAGAFAEIQATEIVERELQSLSHTGVLDQLSEEEHSALIDGELARIRVQQEALYLHVVESYLGEIRRAIEVAADVRRRLIQLRSVVARLPTKPVVFAGVVGLGASFALGVIVPLARPSAPVALWFWTPMGFYMLGLLTLAILVLARYPAPDRRVLADAESVWSRYVYELRSRLTPTAAEQSGKPPTRLFKTIRLLKSIRLRRRQRGSR